MPICFSLHLANVVPGGVFRRARGNSWFLLMRRLSQMTERCAVAFAAFMQASAWQGCRVPSRLRVAEGDDDEMFLLCERNGGGD